MSDETVHKQKFHIRDLPTHSVTLYPARAQVVRNINDVSLRPGANEITIIGLTPTTDENSIKVDGQGSSLATVTDMTVDLIANPDKFDDVYPSDDESDSDSDVESESESGEIQFLLREIEGVQRDIEKYENSIGTIDATHEMLKTIIHKVKEPDSTVMNEAPDIYKSRREELYVERARAQLALVNTRKEMSRLEKKLGKLRIQDAKRKYKEARQQRRENRAKEKAKEEAREAKAKQRTEWAKFWPKQVYRVVLNLDLAGATPTSSRRTSIDSSIKLTDTPSKATGSSSDDSGDVSLLLSYVTTHASWSPKYDLSISTTNKNATVVYRAEFSNTTTETWKDAKVILSTQRTSFGGLNEKIPQMLPWHIKLQRGVASDQATFSPQEMSYNNAPVLYGGKEVKQSNINIGLDKSSVAKPKRAARAPMGRGGGLFGNPSTSRAFSSSGGGVFGSAAPPPPVNAAAPASFMAHTNTNSLRRREATKDESEEEEMGFGVFADEDEPPLQPGMLGRGSGGPGGDGESTLAPARAALSHQESTWTESGLSATYSIPGLRTIPPSDTPRRHKIATINLRQIQLRYAAVPKLRHAAFLKAQLTNTAGITLLKGPAGLTLDGSFLGNTSFPRCEAGETIALPLGVDPGISITYAKPTSKKNVQSGVFSKEESVLYTRVATVTNTKAQGSPVDIVVRDQLPISQDEKLRLEVGVPRGLRNEGDKVPAGVAGEIKEVIEERRASAKGEGDKWGKAVATWKKEAEVEWRVTLNPGKAVRLQLEYEARWPATEGVVNA